MGKPQSQYEVRLAQNEDDRVAAQRLRYAVFIEELGGNGPGVDHERRLECDPFDAYCRHLLLVDRNKPAGEHVVGAYRMMLRSDAEAAGGFYSASEYDLSPLIQSDRSLLELGRSCVHPAHRGGTSMYLLWNGLARFVLEQGVDVMFGVASFHGTDVDQLARPLSYLHAHHLAPEELRVTAIGENRRNMDLLPPSELDRVAAMQETPALIKAYLRLGGFVGDGAYVDHEFNTVDVCLVMDTTQMNAKSREAYTRKAGR